MEYDLTMQSDLIMHTCCSTGGIVMLKICIYFVIMNHMYSIMYRNIFPVTCIYANTVQISNFNVVFTIQRRKLNNKRQLLLRNQVGTNHSLLIYEGEVCSKEVWRGGVKQYSVFI